MRETIFDKQRKNEYNLFKLFHKFQIMFLINFSEWLVTDVCHQPIFEKIATASRLSLAKTRKFCW